MSDSRLILPGFPMMMLANADYQVEQKQNAAGILLAQAAVEMAAYQAFDG